MYKLIDTKIEGFQLRFAEEKDTALILDFIKQLAEYEHLSQMVTATEDNLKQSLFINKSAEVVIGEYNGEPVGFALFYYNYSTFLGQAGIYLEDLFVKPEARGKGIGKMFLAFLAKLAVIRGCGRLEWSCLNWNKSSIEFYKHLGASPMDEWTLYRLTDGSLDKMAKKFEFSC